MKINGACHCGELVFEAEVDAEKVIICHCDDCQRLSGSAFRTVVMSGPDGLKFIKGVPKEYIKTAQSGNPRAQGFCGNCGSAIYATSVGEGAKTYGIRLGTVAQRNELVPQFQIWCSSAQPWLEQLSSLPAFSEGPNARP
ncbi:GFA family protein [Shewanella sp. SR44-3]|uniref:GFA family protein n=1 Tax=Shewanella sp. SR44-3 TaxID=2760936 RepID=UPI0015FD89F4|nr:GFA family protein [Shewanella sp. SR44-3]MBB1270723.1 GFA family protein [Shewanella sp. SR44-3]